jgi:hypothetical protein
MSRPLPSRPGFGLKFGVALVFSFGLICLPVIGGYSGAARAQSAAGQHELQYVVRGLGLKLGDLRIASHSTNGRYRTISQFATTGALRTLAKVRFDLQSEGRWRSEGQTAEPRTYTEAVNTGRRRSSATLTYVGGIPRVDSGAVGRSEQGAHAPLNPLTQRDTIDPATALWLAAGPLPEARLCNLDLPIFDGVRRTRLVLSQPLETEAGFTCRGAFIREAGYGEKQLRKRGNFDVSLNYVRRRDGQFMLIGGRVETIYGPVMLQWYNTGTES